MTTQEKLHAVETAIRKALPRLLKPTEGCWLNVDVPNEGIILFKSFGNFIWYGESYITLLNTELQLYNKIKVSSERYEIIGHDILLTDVLEWLDNLDLAPYAIHNGFLIDLEEMNFDLEVDLSEPYLKDQSEELIDFLFKLIDEE